jgi:hypothetical protein
MSSILAIAAQKNDLFVGERVRNLQGPTSANATQASLLGCGGRSRDLIRFERACDAAIPQRC